jgi:hypothetical protein
MSTITRGGAAVRVFEQAGTSIGGPGGGAADVAEPLAFQKRVDHRGTIAHRQALLADGRNLVDGASDELFAGSGGTDQQNIGIVPRDFAGKAKTSSITGLLPTMPWNSRSFKSCSASARTRRH